MGTMLTPQVAQIREDHIAFILDYFPDTSPPRFDGRGHAERFPVAFFERFSREGLDPGRLAPAVKKMQGIWDPDEEDGGEDEGYWYDSMLEHWGQFAALIA